MARGRDIDDTRTAANDRDAIAEQLEERPPQREREHEYLTRVATSELVESCPPAFRPWLRNVVRNYHAHPRRGVKRFLCQVEGHGIVRAVLMNLLTARHGHASLDADVRALLAPDNRRPNRSVVPVVLRAALATETEESWLRESAVRWLPTYLTSDRDELIALLTTALGWNAEAGGYYAALHLTDLAPDTPGLAEQLLVAARRDLSRLYGWDFEEGKYRKDSALEALARLGCRADVVLPELARRMGGNSPTSWADKELLRTFLTVLPANPARWADEDRWAAALLGKPATAFDWLVYADWLDDRSDPRGEYIRLRHAAASGSAEAVAARGAAWLAEYGRGWVLVYRRISHPNG